MLNTEAEPEVPGALEQKARRPAAAAAAAPLIAKPPPAKPVLDKTALDMLTKAVTASADEDGRANLARVGAHLTKQAPYFARYGFARLSDLVEASGLVDVERIGENPKVVMVKLK